MITYIFNQKFYDCFSNPNLEREIEDRLTDALIQADFDAQDVELRFSDLTLYRNCIRKFSIIADKMEYIYRFLSENEVVVMGLLPTQMCRYVFMNSIPENYNGTESE